MLVLGSQIYVTRNLFSLQKGIHNISRLFNNYLVKAPIQGNILTVRIINRRDFLKFAGAIVVSILKAPLIGSIGKFVPVNYYNPQVAKPKSTTKLMI